MYPAIDPDAHLLHAARHFDPDAQLVLCAGSADTPELGAEVQRLVDELRDGREGVVWIEQMLPKAEVIQLISHATVFACPSIYEPLGIVNLEAMACEAAAVATARYCATRSAPRPWAGRAAGGRSSTSRGRRSPSRQRLSMTA